MSTQQEQQKLTPNFADHLVLSALRRQPGATASELLVSIPKMTNPVLQGALKRLKERGVVSADAAKLYVGPPPPIRRHLPSDLLAAGRSRAPVAPVMERPVYTPSRWDTPYREGAMDFAACPSRGLA